MSNTEELKQNNISKDVKYILSLDGGGIKGAFSARVLDHISTMLGVPIQSKFDLIIGTSIGGLIALGLSQADHKEEIKCENWFTRSNMNTVFDKSILDKALGKFQWKPVYDGSGKRRVINKVLKDQGINECKTDVVITSFQIGKFSPHIFNSWENKDNIRIVADATSAAPIYFPPIRYKNNWFVDGGIGVNNPVVLAIIYAKQRFPNSNIKVLSIGAGSWFPKFDNEDLQTWGLVEWIKHGIIDMFMSSSSRINDMAAELVLGKDFLRINNKKLIDISMDDTCHDTLEKLKCFADESFEKKKALIEQFFL